MFLYKMQILNWNLNSLQLRNNMFKCVYFCQKYLALFSEYFW